MSCKCRRIAKFEKVTFEEFENSVKCIGYPFSDEEIKEY